MKTYARHLFLRILVAFLIINILILSMLSLMQLIKYSYILDYGSLRDLLHIIILSLPSLLFIIIPLSASLASLITYITAIKNSEITILQKLGLNNFNIAIPALLFSILASFFSLYIGFFMGPKSFGGMQNKIFALKTNYNIEHLTDNSFNKFGDLQTYIGKKLNKNTFSNVIIFDAKSASLYIAKKAILDINSSHLFATMYNGVMQKTDSDKQINNLKFQQFTITINLNEYKSQKILNKGLLSKAFRHLIIDKSRRSITEINRRAIWSIYSLLLVLVPLATLLRTPTNFRKPCIAICILVFSYLLLSGLSTTYFHFIYLHYLIFTTIATCTLIKLKG